MEFMSRGPRGEQPAHSPHATASRQRQGWMGKLMRAELFVVIVGAALLLAAVAIYAGSSGTASGEFKKVDQSKYQAVFLNGGVTSGTVTYSTYFGHIKKLNDKYFVINDVYYLTDTQGQNGQAGNPQLTKLGCQQLHSPYDEMVINRSQVAFWENLQDSGKVVQAIKQFKQQNPNGPNCSQSNSNTNNSTAPANSTAPTTTTPQTGTTNR